MKSDVAVRVLLVDDDQLFCQNAVRLLAGEGVRADFVLSGEDCLQRVQEEEFDVLVLDQKMPDLSGTETLRLLRENNCTAEVLLLTGHASVGDACDGTRLNAADYLLKPVSMAVLAAKIIGVYERKQEKERQIPD